LDVVLQRGIEAVSMREIMQLPHLIVRIQALCKVYAIFALYHPNHYRLMFMTPCALCHLDIMKIQQGNTGQDAYAQLKLVMKEAFDAELFKPDITNFELLAQTLWASAHAMCSLEIALSHEMWIHWVDIEARLRLMQTAILCGLLQHF
jgi:hypothetical protein